MAGTLSLSDAAIRLRGADRAFELRVDRLTLDTGRAVALTGASGSGKTLLLELLGLLRPADPGAAHQWRPAGGPATDLAALWTGRRARDHLARLRGALFGFVPQTGGLMPFLTVSENVALPQRLTGRLDPGYVDLLLARLGLSDVARLRPAALSIGQRQRTAIARALAHRPAFVIADEPTAALDPDSANGVLTLLLDTARTEGSGVILSSHDLDRIARFGIPARALTIEATPTCVIGRLSDAAEVPC